LTSSPAIACLPELVVARRFRVYLIHLNVGIVGFVVVVIGKFGQQSELDLVEPNELPQKWPTV
jgi:hypothetical protein